MNKLVLWFETNNYNEGIAYAYFNFVSFLE